MTIERALFLLAGFMVFLTTGLAMLYPAGYWQWFTLFIGFNMIQSTFTGFCPPSYLFKAMGLKSTEDKYKIESKD